MTGLHAGARRTSHHGQVPDFVPGGDLTVGVEEELMVVDARGHLLGAGAASVVARACHAGSPAGVVASEVYVDQVEVNSPACRSAEEVHASLQALRAGVAAHGARLMAVGVHPTAALGEAVIASSPRYDRIVDEYAGLLRTPTAALQVHVGFPDEEALMLAYRGLRQHMPLLRALAAGTPYWHGVDSGLASARAAILRSYPRTTLPPLLTSWDDYVARTEAMTAAAEAPDHTYVWWEMRPRPLLGTLEVRLMDAVPSLAAVAGLTALVQGIARCAVESPGRADLSDDVLAVNDHRAMRHGLETRVVDVDQGLRPLREVAARVVVDARAALAPDGLDAPLDAVEAMLLGEPEPDRQRRLVAAGGMPALLADLAARTADLEA